MDEKQPTKQSNQWLWIAGGVALLACVCLAAVGVIGSAGAIFYLAERQAPGSAFGPAPLPAPATATPALTPLPTVPITPLPGDPPGEALPTHLLDADMPPRDRYDLASRFLGIDEAETPAPVELQVGDVHSFWVDNDDTEMVVAVDAELAYMNDVVYMWVEQGVSYDYDGLARSADRFAAETYPTTRAYFGSEAAPGIDGDPRLHIMHSTQLGGYVLGYFYSPSAFPASIVPYSNEKDMFFVSITNMSPGTAYYDGVLAHEFQHMIHWNVDQNEESWLNEGMSELAAFLNGYGPSDWMSSFLRSPDLQLNDWSEDAGADYGAAFLFCLYTLDRFGQDALQALVANPLNGLNGVDDTLEQVGAGVTADEVFTDWTIANLLNDGGVPPGVYAYSELDELSPISPAAAVTSYPVETGWEQVYQYGTDYIQLTQAGEVTLTFEGAQQVRIIPVDTYDTDGDPATDDRFVWWSNRGDDSNPTLTRAVDLTGVSEAVLEYDVWYSIEEGWDYAYLTVSTDGGVRWTILPTPHTTTDDPHGNSYGAGYTGQSAVKPGADADGWLRERIDLSDYAGQEILLRFEMITDDAVNLPGLAVDNLRIDAIGWYDDAEDGERDWEARGFVRHNNVLSQQFSVQVVVPDATGSVQVLRMPLDAFNQGELTFTVSAERPPTVVISGLTRYTTEPALYRYTVRAAGQ